MRTRTNKRWTRDDLSFIQNNYANMTQFQLAYHFGVRESVMNACIRRYGIRKYGEFWTEQRLSYLKLRYLVATAADIAKEMNIAYCSVAYAIEKFGIPKKIMPNTLCCSECGSENVIIKKELVNVEQ
jgi:hypothetical protein